MNRNETCHVCGGTGEVPVTDWLTKDMTEEEIAKEKEEALADIVEVVRCSDCAHCEIVNVSWLYAKCSMTGVEFKPFGGIDTRKHFCSFGKRKEN